MRAAIHDNAVVANVIEYDPEDEYEPEDGYVVHLLADEDIIGPGWVIRDGVFCPPPEKSLLSRPLTISADGVESSIANYTNTFDDAPTEVAFDVNGAVATVPLIDGLAQLEVTANQPGEIRISVDELVETITATEVI